MSVMTASKVNARSRWECKLDSGSVRIAAYIAQQEVRSGKDRQSACAVLLRSGCGRGHPCLESATRQVAP